MMGDAYFATYFFIASMQVKGIDILMEQNGARKRSTDFRCGEKLGERDHLVVLNNMGKAISAFSSLNINRMGAAISLKRRTKRDKFNL